MKKAPEAENDYKNSFLIKFLDQGDAFDVEGSLTRGGANRPRIPKPATKEEMKLNQNRQHAIAGGDQMP